MNSVPQRFQPVFHSLLFWVLLCLGSACMPEEEMITSDPNARLVFSQDTVLFDTLFSDIRSITRRLKVYNPNRRALVINRIALAAGEASAYTVYVNGRQHHLFENIPLSGGDSLLLLLEADISSRNENLPFLVKDSLLFSTGLQTQDVKLISWGQDARFIRGMLVQEDVTLSGERPYLIYDSIKVAREATLTIAPGTRLYFHAGAKLVVDGALRVAGTPEKKVWFTSDRSDGQYAQGAGQWQGIVLNGHSRQHHIEHAIIRNARQGISIAGNASETVRAILGSTIIENMSETGITAVNAHVEAYNMLVNRCAMYAVSNTGGGTYQYAHCTFDNSYISRAGGGPALFFADTASLPNNSPFRLLLENNIIWGNRADELQVVQENAGSQAAVRSNLIRSRNEASYAADNVLNEDPLFLNAPLYDYRLDTLSPAIDKGRSLQIQQDIAGNPRDSLPDMGAYEYVQINQP